MKKIIYPLAALLALYGCTSESDSLVTAPQGEPVVLSGNIVDIASEVTRAPIESTHAAALDVAFARIDQAADGTWPAWATVNRALLASRAVGTGGITFKSGYEQYYPTATTNNAIRLRGWHPATVTPVSDQLIFTIDGKTDIMATQMQEGSASSKFTSSSKVFAFAHRLSRITVKAYGDAQASANWGTITSVKVLNTYVAYKIYLSTGVENLGARGTITLKNPANDSNMSAGVALTNTTTATAATCGYALLYPQASYTLEVTTSLGGTRQVMVYPASDFSASTHYTVYLNFKSTTISPYATVEAWTNSGEFLMGDIQD